MQINLKSLLTIGFCCVLTSCTDTLESDTHYQSIKGDFPRLSDVPDRPSHPTIIELEQQQQLLLQSSRQAKIIKQETFTEHNIKTTEQPNEACGH